MVFRESDKNMKLEFIEFTGGKVIIPSELVRNKRLLTFDEIKKLVPDDTKYWVQGTPLGISRYRSAEDTMGNATCKKELPLWELDIILY
jgi:hypothetical protein